MLDQAEALRLLVKDRVLCARPVEDRPRLHVIAITSGKGGVGKTSIAVNLAMLLSKSGRRVRLVDADFGLSNAEVLMGVAPSYTLHDVLRGDASPHEAWTDAMDGVKLLSSGSGLEDLANLDGASGAALVDYVLGTAADGDVVLIDTAPGIDESVISLLSIADEVLVVTTPEPTSIADCYAAIKVMVGHSVDARIRLVANNCSSPAQAEAIARGIENVCIKFLGRGLQGYEYLPADPEVGKAIRAQRPVVGASRHAAVVPWLRRLAIKLEAAMAQRHPEPARMAVA